LMKQVFYNSNGTRYKRALAWDKLYFFSVVLKFYRLIISIK